MGCGRWVRWAGVALALAAAAPAAAVVTEELIHDTPRTREMLKRELGAVAVPSPAASPAVGVAATGARGEFEAIWFAREKYLEIGEAEKAQQQLRNLWERALARGVRNLPEYSAVLVREAERRMNSGNWDEAARALGWARRLAPDDLPPYAAGALLALRRNPFNPVPVWEEISAGARAAGRSFRLQAWLRANLLGALTAGLATFFAVAIAIAGVAAAPRLVHDIRESMRFGSPRTRTVLAWGALAAPALVGLSPWWWVVCAALLLWPYFAAPLRVLVAAGAVFLLALPLAVRERAALLTLSERPVLAAAAQVREGNWSAADYATLKAEAERGNAGVPVLNALGVAARRLGRLDESEAALQAARKLAPDDAVLRLNLGNVAFAKQDLPGAAADFAKAAELAPGLFEPHFNLGVAHRAAFKFAEGEAETRRAAELDPEAASYYAGLDPARLKGFTIDGRSPVGALWSLARAPAPEPAAATQTLWESLMLGAPIALWPVVAAALLALGAAFGAWRLRRGTATECSRCGHVFCASCQPARRGEFCTQCHHIFVKKEGVDARARVQKMGEIKGRQRLLRLRHLACAAIAPGGGLLSAGRPLPGLLLLAPASFLAPRLLFGSGAFPSPWSLGSAASSWVAGVATVALAALWAYGAWLTLRLRD